jgi:hypothetical protein
MSEVQLLCLPLLGNIPNGKSAQRNSPYLCTNFWRNPPCKGVNNSFLSMMETFPKFLKWSPKAAEIIFNVEQIYSFVIATLHSM